MPLGRRVVVLVVGAFFGEGGIVIVAAFREHPAEEVELVHCNVFERLQELFPAFLELVNNEAGRRCRCVWRGFCP